MNHTHGVAPDEAGAGSSADVLDSQPGVARVRMVIVEDGSFVTDEPPPQDALETVLLTQGGGERPADFARRVERRIQALRERGTSIDGTVLRLSPRFDAEVTKARVSIGHTLAAHVEVAAAGPSQLLISAGVGLDAALEAKVRALADVLMIGSNSRALPVIVQFT